MPKQFKSLADVAKWLGTVKTLDERINAKVVEYEQLWTLATKVTAEFNDMPHGSDVTDKVGNIGDKLVMWAEETNALIGRFIDLKREIISTLETLPLNEYKVLHRYYIRYMTIKEIAEDIGYSERHTDRIKQNGLNILKDGAQCR